MNEHGFVAGLVFGCLMAYSVNIQASPVSAYQKISSEAIRVACVGDSITYGEGIADREHNCYPAQLAVLLGPKYQVENFGVSGTTVLRNTRVAYVRQPEFLAALAFKPNRVVICLGTNDIKSHNWRYQEQFISDYLALITAFQNLDAQPHIFLCYPTPTFPGRWDIDDAAITQELIPKIVEVATQTHLAVIDLHTALGGKKVLFPDTVHPNAQGAGLIAEKIKRALQAEGLSSL